MPVNASKSSVAKVAQPVRASGNHGRNRRPSDKVAAQLDDQREAAKLRAEKAERRAHRQKMAQQKLNQQAGLLSGSEDEFQPRKSPTFASQDVTMVTKPTLVKRHSKVPSPTQTRNDDDILENDTETSSRTVPQWHKAYHIQGHRPPSRTVLSAEPVSRPASPSLSLEMDQQENSKSVHHSNQTTRSTPPRSLSPQTGDKRRHGTALSTDGGNPDDDTDGGDETEVFVVKAQKISKNAGRPKAADYEETARDIILAAASTYRALLGSQGAFPDSSKELVFIKKAWKLVNDESGMQPMELTPNIVRILKQRGSQIRGEAKSKTSSLVEAFYGFDSGRSKSTISNNRNIAEELKKEKGFVFSVLFDDDGKRKGIYQHPIIQKSVNAMWFKNKRDEGIIHSDLFDPLSVYSIALILTAVESNIDEWITGIKTDITFYADEYRTVYDSHVNSLRAFGEYSKTKNLDLLGRIQRRLYNFGRLHAGVSTTIAGTRNTIPTSAFDDAVRDYEENSETDDEGDMIEA